jgi:hypothetical protein
VPLPFDYRNEDNDGIHWEPTPNLRMRNGRIEQLHVPMKIEPTMVQLQEGGEELLPVKTPIFGKKWMWRPIPEAKEIDDGDTLD